MSNPIRYDSLLIRHLARELRDRVGGRLCRSVPVRLGEHGAVLPLDAGEALALDLHPSRGWVRLVPWREGGDPLLDAEVAGVDAPPDERRLVLTLQGGTRFRSLQRRLVVELQTNHWNLLTLDPDGRIVFVLRPREALGRTLRPGEPYTQPAPAPRLRAHSRDHAELWAEWRDVLSADTERERIAAVQRRFAWLGPVNTAAVLGAAAADPSEVERRAAFDRWLALAALPRAEPVVLHLPHGLHPYPVPLPGVPSETVPTLLEGMERAAAATPVEQAPADDRRSGRIARVERRLDGARTRVQRLQEQLERVGDAERDRGFGDLLLAHLAQVPRGAARVVLPGWDGGEVEIELDPSLSPADNAARWYDAARRHERAGAQLPQLLEAAEQEVARWVAVLAALRDGALDGAEGSGLDELPAAPRPGGGPAGEVRHPFRVYRTSGGLEVRVGRGSADNDRLTFGHSRPEDVWLHARSVPGSHVILRWGNAEHAPPARDLSEAAGLAAWFSKARTSGLVAVDWTRRKHVRKPRGAAPGQVIPQRVKTVMVEPDEALVDRLATEPE